jgi:hypothetical protein
MSEAGKPQREIDMVLYARNRRTIPLDTLACYAGQWVAFSADGTRVVASGNTIDELDANLQAAGIDAGEVGWERIPALDEGPWL